MNRKLLCSITMLLFLTFLSIVAEIRECPVCCHFYHALDLQQAGNHLDNVPRSMAVSLLAGAASGGFSGLVLSSGGLAVVNPIGFAACLAALFFEVVSKPSASTVQQPQSCSCFYCPCGNNGVVANNGNSTSPYVQNIHNGSCEAPHPVYIQSTPQSPGQSVQLKLTIQDLQHEYAQNNFNISQESNTVLAQQWQEIAPHRSVIYERAHANNFKPYDALYTLSDRTQQFLAKENIHINSSQHFFGNDLQHCLHQEVITGVELASFVHTKSSQEFIQEMAVTSVHVYENACKANEIGDVRSAAVLVDTGHAMSRWLAQQGLDSIARSEWISQCIQNFCKGFFDETIALAREFLLHPIQSLQNIVIGLGNFACQAKDFVIPQVPGGPFNPDAFELYKKELSAMGERWSILAKNLWRTWQETPGEVIAEHAGAVVADCFILDAYFKVLGTGAKFACKELHSGVINLATRAAEVERSAPGYFLTTTPERIHPIREALNYRGIPEKTIMEGLFNLEECYPGATEIIASALREIGHADHVIDHVVKVIEQAAMRQKTSLIPHICRRLEQAKCIARTGENVVSVCGKPLECSTFVSRYCDIATDQKVIKYIDASLPSLADLVTKQGSNRLKPLYNFQKSIMQQRAFASQIGKKYELHCANTISRDWADWFKKENFTINFVKRIELEAYLATILSEAETAELTDYARQFSFVYKKTGESICPELDIKHVFLPDVQWRSNGSCEISGLHHDWYTRIAQEGFIEISTMTKIEAPADFYAVEVMYNGSRKPSSCFPQHWDRKKVISKIFEAANNPIECVPNGKKLKITGLIDEGVKIQLIFDPTSNVIESAWPLLFGG